MIYTGIAYNMPRVGDIHIHGKQYIGVIGVST